MHQLFSKGMGTALACASLVSGCAAPISEDAAQSHSSSSLELTDEVTTGTLTFLNDVGTTREVLDETCGFYSNAAVQTIKHRDGRDRLYPSSDDDPFDSLDEFAAVAAVGPAHVERAVDCAIALGFVDTCATFDSTLVESYAELSPELQGFVDDRIAEHALGGGPLFRFFEAETFTECGAVTRHRVRLGRLIDPEGGIVETVDYTLDAHLQILDEYWDAG